MEITLQADAGRAIGSAASRRLRRQGMVPAIVYGQGADPLAVAVSRRELVAALSTEAGVNALIRLEVDGDTHLTLARQIQRHPVRGEISHADFIKVSLEEKVEAEVNVTFVGIPHGVAEGDGIVEAINPAVAIEALVTDIPNHIELDISQLEIGDVLRVSDLPALPGVEYLDDPDDPIVTVSLPTPEEIPEVEEELEEGEELEEVEGEEGEAAATDEPADEGGE